MRILLVDDEQSFLNVLGDVLRDYGYDVVQAEDGGAARTLAEAQKFDLVISDVFMPTLSGPEFHKHIRGQSPDLPFIFLSGFDHDRARTLVQDPDRDFFLSKTSPLETIVACIERVRVS